MKKQTYAVPEGCKITSVDFETNTVVYESVEQKKYVPKVGDCVKLSSKDGNRAIFVFDGLSNDGCAKNKRAYIGSKNSIYINTAIPFDKEFCIFTELSKEEYQEEFNKLGSHYDFSTHTASKLKWMPKYGEKYHYVDADGNTCLSEWKSDIYDNKRIKINNVHKTIADAEKFIQYIKDYDTTK